MWKKFEDPNITINNQRSSEYDDDDMFSDDQYQDVPPKVGMLMPVGPVNLVGYLLSLSQFDFWVMHTNFRLTNNIINIISEVEGVEVINPLTRYRVKLGFPNSGLFQTDKIKKDIEKDILDFCYAAQNEVLEVFADEICGKVKEFRNYLENKYDEWTLYILPNGGMEVYNFKDEKQLEILQMAQSLVGGQILIS